MSRRGRAIAFLAAALACALLAAMVAGRYRASVESRYGELRPALVASAELPAGKVIAPGKAEGALAVRRIPARFVPPGALRDPAEAVGRAPAAPVPAGSYLLDAQLVWPAPSPPPAAGAGRRPLQVEVLGGEALVAGGASPEGGRVDVVVSRRSGLGERGEAEVVASGVKLLAVSGPQGPGEGWSATLAVSRAQALELIEAEAGGGEIRLLPRP